MKSTEINCEFLSLRSWVRFDSRCGLATLMSYVKESVNTKVVGFLRVFWFPPQGMLTGWVGVSPLTDPSTVAMPRDQT